MLELKSSKTSVTSKKHRIFQLTQRLTKLNEGWLLALVLNRLIKIQLNPKSKK